MGKGGDRGIGWEKELGDRGWGAGRGLVYGPELVWEMGKGGDEGTG